MVQTTTAEVLISLATVMSWCSCVFIFVMAARTRCIQVRSTERMLPNFQLGQCVAAWIASCSNVITMFRWDVPPPQDENGNWETTNICRVTAWLTAFGESAVIFWVCVISVFVTYDLARSTVDPVKDRRLSFTIHQILWPLAMIWTIIPAKHYGVFVPDPDSEIYWCWFEMGTPEGWHWFQFFGPLSFAMLLSFVCCILTVSWIRRYAENANRMVYFKVLSIYLVLALIFTPTLIQTLVHQATRRGSAADSKIFTIVANVCWKLEGFLISLLIISNSQTRAAWSAYFSGQDPHHMRTDNPRENDSSRVGLRPAVMGSSHRSRFDTEDEFSAYVPPFLANNDAPARTMSGSLQDTPGLLDSPQNHQNRWFF